LVRWWCGHDNECDSGICEHRPAEDVSVAGAVYFLNRSTSKGPGMKSAGVSTLLNSSSLDNVDFWDWGNNAAQDLRPRSTTYRVFATSFRSNIAILSALS
jgi:hypothetical protein